MARTSRDAGIPALVNGSDSTDRAPTYLDAGFIAVIRGELETRLCWRPCRHWPSAACGIRIPRFAICDRCPCPPGIWWTSILPAAWKAAHGYFSMNMVSSRGCPYRCNWCAKPLWGDTLPHYSAATVWRRRWNAVKDRFAPDQIWFADDIFALSQQWTHEFADARGALERANSVQDAIALRPDDARHGGALCGAPDAPKSGWAWSRARRVSWTPWIKGCASGRCPRRARICADTAFAPCFFLQFGYPGEEWEEIEQTIRLVRETKPDDIGVSVSYPLPNTRFHQMVRASSAPKNWSDSGDLDMMFQGAFPTEFYRALADALHLEVQCGNGGGSERLRLRERLGAKSSNCDAPAADAWLFSARGRQGATDHEALSAARNLCISLPICARGDSTWRFTIPPSDRATDCSAFWRRPAGWPRRLRQFDDAPKRHRDRVSARGLRLARGRGRAGAGELRGGVSRRGRGICGPG